jgi:hypothetical protein
MEETLDTPRSLRLRLAPAFLAVATLGGCLGDGAVAPPDGTTPFTLVRLSDPDRTVVQDEAGEWVATFTDGAYTVAYRGVRTRTFAEADDTVRHDVWVRILDRPFPGIFDAAWLDQARADGSPDLLGVAMQYIAGAPAVYEDGLKVGGQAGYGPGIGSDFHDYLGITWVYPNGTVREPRPDRLNTMDCSGYTRMVFGYRGTPHRVPMSISISDGTTLPRTSFNQYRHGTGVVLIPNEETTPPLSSLGALQPGDLLFWRTSTRDTPGGITHVGIYLGRDTRGGHRFIHSAGSSDGPVFGREGSTNDYVLDHGYYMTAFRAARRL